MRTGKANMKTSMRPSTRRRRGSTLIFVVLLVVSTSVLSLAMLSNLSSSQQAAQGSQQDMSSFYTCEAGLNAAVMNLSGGGDGNIGSKKAPVVLGSGSYWVSSADLGGGMYSLQATGGDQHSTLSAEMIVQLAATGLYRWGAFADDDLHMDSNARTDSYDSTLGTYGSQVTGSGNSAHANENGSVGSNESVTMDSNTTVWGNAHPGPSGTLVLTGQAQVTGATVPSVSEINFPPITVPALVSSGSLSISSDTTLPAGDYRYDQLDINGSDTLTLMGPSRLVVDDFLLSSNAEFVVDGSAGPVEIYVIHDFLMSSNTLIASTTFTPSDVTFHLLSNNIVDPNVQVNLDADEVNFNSNAIMYGTIYAPNAWIEIDSNFELFGSIVANRVDLDSNSQVHYDESLARQGSGSSGVWDTLCWRVLPQN